MNIVGIVSVAWLMAAAGPWGAARPAWAAAAREVWVCPMHDSPPTDRPGRCPTCGMERVRQSAIGSAAAQPPSAISVTPAASSSATGKPLWHCPMHPQVVQDKPGECPICFMRLVPVKQEDVRMPISGRAVVTLPAERRRQLGVVTVTVRSRPLARVLRLPGRVAHDPDLYAALNEYRAAVEAAKGRNEGPLADVLEAAEIKLAHFGIAGDQAREMMNSGHLRHLILPGDHVWVHASAFEQDLPWIRRGQSVMIEVPALPGRRLSGTVEAVEPALDPVSRTATVRILAANPAGAAMKLEMYATVRIEAGSGSGLVVPRDAVMDTGERRIVFVVKGDALEPREIETGMGLDDGVEVRRGLVAGDEIVASGNFLIDADSQIRAAIAVQSAGSATGHEAPAAGAAGHAGHVH